MPVSITALQEAIDSLAHVEGMQMAPSALLEDVVLLARVWPDEDEFAHAVANTQRALQQVVQGAVDATPLAFDLEGWFAYHYQQRRGQGERSVMRVVFRRTDGGIEVAGFGHRFKPAPLYQRLREDARWTVPGALC